MTEPRARFKPHGTMFVPARRELVIWGIALVGNLRPGMLLTLKLGNLSVTSPLETVDLVEINGAPFVAVRIAGMSPEALGFWGAMQIGEDGEELAAFD